MTRIIDFRVRLPFDLRPLQDVPRGYQEQYNAILGLQDRRQMGLQQLLEDMDAAGVEHAIVHAEYEFGDPADALNDAVAQLVAEHPRKFSGYGTVSLEQINIMRAITQTKIVAEMGLLGIAIQPSFFGMPIDHPKLYPVYAKACELGLAVAVHTGINYTLHHPIKNDHPLQVDQVACDFPELTMIACHAGWPWVTEMVAVARKHPNVYLEFGGLAPKYVGSAGTGWEPMFRFMNSLLSKQVLYGTDWPVFPMKRAIAEWASLDLKPSVLEALMSGNAARLLEAKRLSR